MSASQIGLSLSSSSFNAPAGFIAWNWFWAYCALAPRNFKQIYGIDHNSSPRQDLEKYGPAAVREGKMTQAQLDQIYRVQAASANSTEGFILFTASLLFSLVTNVPESKVKTACTIYSVARIFYGFFYVFLSDDRWSQLRGLSWWVANVSCFYLLYNGAKQSA